MVRLRSMLSLMYLRLVLSIFYNGIYILEQFEKTIGKCSFVLYFECSKATLTQRLLKRGETSGRSDDNEASIAKRLATFDASSMPVIDLYTRDGRVKAVNSEGNVDDVTVTTMECFK